MQRTLESLDQWKIPFAILVAYWIIAALILRFVYRRWCSKRRAQNPKRFRFWLALFVAIIFTPSLVGDFWLFAVPAPAILGVLLLVPAGFSQSVYWLIVLVFYILPMALVFGIAYAVLRRQDSHLYPRTV
jgi:hypothetical protein